MVGFRAYYLLIAAQTISSLGSQVGALSISIDIYKNSGQATPIALVSLFATLPAIVAAGLGGALADRLDRRKIMLCANLGLILINAALLGSFLSGAFRLWHLYTVSAFASLLSILWQPSFQASITVLIPDRHRNRANAVSQLAGPTAGLVSPVLAGLLYAFVGVTGSILANIISFFAVTVTLFFIRIPMPSETEEGAKMRASIWSQAFDGLRFLKARPALLVLIGYVSLVNLLFRPLMVLMVPYILSRTGSERDLGLVLGISEAGSILGASAMFVWGGTRWRINTILPSIGAAGLFMSAAGTARETLPIAASLCFASFALALANPAGVSMIQAKVPRDLQGRVFAAWGQIGLLLSPFGVMVAGPFADHLFEPAIKLPWWRNIDWLVGASPGAGIGLMFVISGAATVLLSLAMYALPAIHTMEARLPNYGDALPPD